MANIAKNLTDLIGNTPLLELVNYRMVKGYEAAILAKLEYFNPLGSVTALDWPCFKMPILTEIR